MSKNLLFTIRPAAERDIPFLADCIGSLFSLEKDFSADTSKQVAGLSMLLRDTERARVLVAEDPVSGACVGMVSVQLVISTSQGGYSAWLEDLYVLEAYRSKGVASALLEALQRWCLDKGCRRVQLLADRDNTGALAFYDIAAYEATNLICRRRFL